LPVTIRKYTELKLAISDYVQRRNWTRLFELCGTSDAETAKTIAVILTFYDPKRLWSFLEFVSRLSVADRREKRDSVATCCYLLGKIGQTRLEKSLDYLREFLASDHMLRGPVEAALSNLWVLNTKKTSDLVWNQWVIKAEENEDLQEIGVRSSEYLAKHAPERISSFLVKVASLDGSQKVAARTATQILEEIGISRRAEKATPRIRKKTRK
jgi:hypothetical protein